MWDCVSFLWKKMSGRVVQDFFFSSRTNNILWLAFASEYEMKIYKIMKYIYFPSSDRTCVVKSLFLVVRFSPCFFLRLPYEMLHLWGEGNFRFFKSMSLRIKAKFVEIWGLASSEKKGLNVFTCSFNILWFQFASQIKMFNSENATHTQLDY